MMELLVAIQFLVGLMIGVCKGFCRCNLVSENSKGEVRFPEHQGWHSLGALCSNMLSRRHQFFENNCRYAQASRP